MLTNHKRLKTDAAPKFGGLVCVELYQLQEPVNLLKDDCLETHTNKERGTDAGVSHLMRESRTFKFVGTYKSADEATAFVYMENIDGKAELKTA